MNLFYKKICVRNARRELGSGEHGRRAVCDLTNSGHGVKPGQIDFAEGCLGKGPWI